MSTTIRLDKKAKQALTQLAQHIGVSFSDIVNMFGHAVRQGKLYAGIMEVRSEKIFEYPDWYAEKINQESEETERLLKEGKLKTYRSADEAMDALLKEAKQYE